VPDRKGNVARFVFIERSQEGLHTFLQAQPTLPVSTPIATACPAAGTRPPIDGTFDDNHCVACSLTSAKTTAVAICLSKRIVPRVDGRNPYSLAIRRRQSMAKVIFQQQFQ
jgi:hypothetical protein